MQEVSQPIGPYSIKREKNGLIFLSGQLPIHPKTGELINDFESACRGCLNNIKDILTLEQIPLSSIIKLTVLTTQLDHMDLINQVFEEFFEQPYPARSAFEVSKLPKNAVIEIEAIVAR